MIDDNDVTTSIKDDGSHYLQPISSETTEPTDSQSTKYDDILNRIGTGRYQLKILGIYACLGWLDGAESLAMSFIVPIFQQMFGSEVNIKSVLGTCVYFGGLETIIFLVLTL